MKKEKESNLTEAEKELVSSIKIELMRPICNYDDEKLLGLIKKAYGRSEGHWIKHTNPNLGVCMKELYECSNCRAWLGCQYFVRKSYCPNCGAKMEDVNE